MERCSFCMEPSLMQCLNKSLHNKHRDEYANDSSMIDDLLNQEKTWHSIKFAQLRHGLDEEEYVKAFVPSQERKKEFKQLQDYYKFRLFVPLFVPSNLTSSLQAYYYRKLKHYYNSIKRKLHLTIDQTSQTQISLSNSQFTTSNMPQSNLLKSFQIHIHPENIQQLPKTESKALQDLLLQLQTNPKFEKIQTLNSQDCFYEQNIFESNSVKMFYHQNRLQQNSKLKFLKKGSVKTQIKYLKEVPQPPKSIESINNLFIEKAKETNVFRSKSSKTIKSTSNQYRSQKFNPYQLKEIQIHKRLSQPKLFNAYPKAKQFLQSTRQIIEKSPYKKQSASLQKIKNNKQNFIQFIKGAGTLKITSYKTNRTNECNQFNKMDKKVDLKPSIQSKDQEKKRKISVELSKNDNMVTIRRKKLQSLREKVGK